MSRYPTERHNEEFRSLYDSSDLTRQEIAELLGVSFDTVRSWLKPETAKSGFSCPKYRVEMFKQVLARMAILQRTRA